VHAIVQASLMGDGYVEKNFRIRLSDGSIRHVKSMAISQRDDKGEWERHVGVAIDVTEHVQRERALLESSRRKDEFLAMLAHELRNPLAPIAAAADLLELAGTDAELVAKSSAVIARQVRHMTGLVDDLLDVARVTRGQVSLDLANVEIHQPVREAMEQVRPLMDARGHQLTLRPLPQPALVRADPKRLVQVLTNLLTNAAKYTPVGGRITVEIGADAGTVHLCVIDTGEGMSPDLLKRCFELFVQAQRTSERAAGGLGIGLALVRSLVELQGGSVRAESEGPGKGSRLTVTIPRLMEREDLTTGRPVPAQRPQGARRARVLIVDDNEDAAGMLGMLVRALGYEPVVEYHPRDALERMAANPPEICLLDVGLPEMDGYELAKAIRRQLGPAPATLIAITGYGQPHDREDALRAGFDEHIVKPVERSKLAQLLAEAGRPCLASSPPVSDELRLF
jgi:signal transduction histidine kinase/ActR/RegA family two-component response regulator